MKKHKFFSFNNSKFEQKSFNPETQYAVIRSSICTGEKVAGFKDKKDGHFTEVMLIRSPKDLEEFKKTYMVDSVKTEY
ncbi:MAG: aspartate dehydrogenase [Ruminococcus sp.]|nr:aspartate dehydrogenase [Ruminococcus sp.]